MSFHFPYVKVINIVCQIILLLMTAQVSAKPVVLTPQQISNLGIKTTQLQKTEQVTTNAFPAKVVIPNKAQRIVNTVQNGVVTQLTAAEGDVIKEGIKLAEINSPDLVLLQKAYLQSYSELQHMQHQLERDDKLFKEGIISEKRFHESKIAYDQQKTNLDSERKTLQLSGMDETRIKQLAQEKLFDSKVTLLAPVSGVVMRQYVVPGQRVNAADPLYQIADLSTLWLEIHVPLSAVSTLQPEDKVVVCDREITAEITTIGREVHALDQGVLVRAVVDKETDKLTPGEFVEVCFLQHIAKKLFTVNTSAIFRFDQQDYIFVESNSGFLARQVERVSEQNDKSLISVDGTAEVVVVEGVAALKAAWLAEMEQ